MLATALLLLLPGQVHLQGTTTADGGDYLLLPFEVPAGTVEFQVAHSDMSDENILDWGIWGPEGWRGWGGGLTDDAIVGVEESSRGYAIGPITAGTWNVVIGKAKILTSPAQYVVDITFRTTATLTVRARDVDDGYELPVAPRWYSGDLHVHSSESGDAHASFEQITALARQRHLDFVAVSDHNTVSQHPLIAAYAKSEAAAGRNDVLLMRSAEVTTYKGHGGALGATQYINHRVGLDGLTGSDVIQAVHRAGGLFIMNHPVLDLGNACIGCAWTHADTPWNDVDALEIHTGPYQPVATLFTPQAIALWDEKLNAGFHITAVGGSDDHTAGTDTGQFASPIGSPTTRVFADSLSQNRIMAGIKLGHVVVALRGPDDPGLELFAAGDFGEDAMIGDRILASKVTLRAHVTGGHGFSLGLFRNGRLVDPRPITSDDATETWDFSTATTGDRYRVHVMDGDLDVVVTNHIFVGFASTEKTARRNNCVSLSAVGSGVPAGLLLLIVAMGRARRRRRMAPASHMAGVGKALGNL